MSLDSFALLASVSEGLPQGPPTLNEVLLYLLGIVIFLFLNAFPVDIHRCLHL